jgi:CopG family nickel-responsive transcriptional regulator
MVMVKVKSDRVERFSVSAPPDLVNEFDETLEKTGQDRSKAIQQAMRLFLAEQRWKARSGDCAGAIVLIYDHEVHDAEQQLTDLQHAFRDVINSALHLHIDEKNCLQIIAVRGRCDGVSDLIEKISACKGVKQVKFTIVDI